MIKQALSTLAETTAQAGLIGLFFSNSPPVRVQNAAGPICLAYSAIYQALSKACHIEDKPRLVQVAFPFVSGLVATAALAPFLGLQLGDLAGTYFCSSAIISLVVLVKHMGQRILNGPLQAKDESYVSRMFNYTTTGAASLVPACFAGAAIAEGILNNHQAVPACCGLFFGLTQVCVSRLLGASKENAGTQFALPLFVTAIPTALIGIFSEGFTAERSLEFAVPFATISLGVALVSTIAARFLTPAPKETQTGEVNQQRASNTSYQRWGSTSIGGSAGWEKTATGWKQKTA